MAKVPKNAPISRAPRTGKRKNYRTFGSYVYYHFALTKSREKANRIAKKLRQHGMGARITPGTHPTSGKASGMFNVWVHYPNEELAWNFVEPGDVGE